MKRLLALILTLTMVLSLPMVAQAQEQTLPYTGEKPIQITYMGIDFRTSDRTFDKIVDQMLDEMIKEKFGNVEIVYNLVAESDYSDKVKLAIAAGDLSDITMVYDTPQGVVNAYGDYGVMLNYANYLEYMPNYAEDAAKYNLVYGTNEGDEILALCPNISNYNLFTWGGTINTHVAQKYELAKPATAEELLANLRAIKAANPDCASPYITFPGNCLLSGLNQLFLGCHYDSVREDLTNVLYDEEKGEWYYPIFTDAFKAEIEYARTLYTEGLVAPDYLTYTWDKFVSMLYDAEDWYYLGYWNIFGADQMTQIRAEAPDFSYESGVGIASDYLPEGSIVPTATIGSSKGAVVTNINTQYPELVCQLIDFFHSEDVAMLIGWGIEGETYTKRDEPMAMMDIMYDFTPELAIGVNKATGTVNPLTTYGLCYDDYRHQFSYLAGHKNNETMKAQMLFEQDHPEKVEFINTMFAYAAEHPDAVVNVEPTPTMTVDEGEDIAKIMNAVNTVYASEIMTFIKGERSMDEWDDFMTKLKGAGDIDRVLEIYNSKDRIQILAN